MYKVIIFIFISFFGAIFLKGQNTPLNHLYSNYLKGIHSIESSFHSSIKPYNQRDVQNLIDSAFTDIMRPRKNWIARKLFNEDFIKVEEEDYQLIVNPLGNLNLGVDNNRDDILYTNTRGLELKGRIGEKLTFYTDFYENQALLPQYIHKFSIKNRVIPGEGRSKNFNDTGARDWGVATGLINFQASKFFNIQFGHGKNFIGDGYRSLLLSDNAYNYPFLKITTSVWKLKYMNLYTQMFDIRDNSPSGTFVKKYVTTHYLSVNIGKRFNIGLFESIIYEDSSGTRGYDVNYLNPIIFYRPVEFAVGSKAGNVLMGINLKYKLTDNAYLYGQFIIDEFRFSEIKARNGWWGNKFGIQLGGKIYDLLFPGLTIQSEINIVRPYTYSHLSTFQNYAHYNQPLAHPLGANFLESVTHISYQKKRIFATLEIMYASQGKDSNKSNWGADVYKDYDDREQEYGNEIGQGVKTLISYTDLRLGYLLNPKTNLRFQIGVRYRKFSPELEIGDLVQNTTNYFYTGISTNLRNRYQDF